MIAAIEAHYTTTGEDIALFTVQRLSGPGLFHPSSQEFFRPRELH